MFSSKLLPNDSTLALCVKDERQGAGSDSHTCCLFFVSLLYSNNQERVYPTEYNGHFERLVITREEILQRVHDLGKEINQDYAGRRPVLLCVLKGANPVRLY